MNDYQKEVQNTVELLYQTAQKANGRVLDAGAVRRICTYIASLQRAIEMKDIALMGCDNMLAAYINEYGESLLNTLMNEDIETVEAIVVEEETGQASEGTGLDASDEGEES